MGQHVKLLLTLVTVTHVAVKQYVGQHPQTTSVSVKEARSGLGPVVEVGILFKMFLVRM